MKEHELTALMERAGDGLAPDVEGLVAGGAARGRRALRRRRVASGFGAAAAVCAIAVAATVLSGGGGTPNTVPDHAPAGVPTTQRELADRTVIEERLLEALPEGEVTELSIRTNAGDDGALVGVQVRLLLDGAEVTASVADTSRDAASFPDPGSPPEGCDASVLGGEGTITLDELEDSLNELAARTKGPACWTERQAPPPPPCDDAGCIRLPDGSWLRSGMEATYEDDPGRPTEWPRAWATRATADHWWLSVDAGGPAKWAAPVLDEEQVAALARSDIWFE